MCPYILGAGEAQRHRQGKRESVGGWGLRWTKAEETRTALVGMGSRGASVVGHAGRERAPTHHPQPRAATGRGSNQFPTVHRKQKGKEVPYEGLSHPSAHPRV